LKTDFFFLQSQFHFDNNNNKNETDILFLIRF